jgi:SGNH domain (fused to AT3 domains)
VLEYLQQTSSVRIVVLSSPFNQYVNDIGELLERPTAAGGFRSVNQSVEVALAGVRRTVGAVRALGKRVVVVAPPPATTSTWGVARKDSHAVGRSWVEIHSAG